MAEQAVENPFKSGNYKLGLALSGGGFRASLFHIGVLARMAELDLLGKVEVISAVSGGSIVGATYYLMLKELMERPGAPTAADYVELIQRLQARFLAGVQVNPRTRLITNPFVNTRMLLTDYSRTERMARLLNKYFYRPLWQGTAGKRVRAIPLSEIKINPPGSTSRDDYNASHVYKIPMLVINATTLNTGMNFRFTASEVGDPELGFIRFDDVDDLSALRQWLFNPALPFPPGFTQQAARLMGLAREDRLPQSLRPLLSAPLNLLHKLKVSAWLATYGIGAIATRARGDLDRQLQRMETSVDPVQRDLQEADLSGLTIAESFRLVYLFRIASQVTKSIGKDMGRLSLERAVAASAAVPGIFEPIVFRDLYDDALVEAVRLADGGVYDNQGLTALFEEGCTHVICSDASGQLVFERDVAGKLTGVLPRTNDVLMEKVRRDELETLRITHDSTEGLITLQDRGCIPNLPRCTQPLEDLYEMHHVKQTAFFHLRNTFRAAGLPAPPDELQDAISKIRTDLDSFTDTEAYTLMYDGYYLASHTLIPRWFSDVVPPGTTPQSPPDDRWSFYPPPLGKPDLLDHIKAASHRLFKVFRLWWNRWGLLAWLTAVGILVAAAYWFPLITLNYLLVWPLWLVDFLFGYSVEPITVGSLLPFRDWIVAYFPRLKNIVDFPVLPLGDLFNLKIHVPSIILAVLLGSLLYRLWGPVKAWLLSGETRRVWPIVRLLIRLKRSPIFPIALVWGLVVAVAAWVHLGFFDRWFLKAGRV